MADTGGTIGVCSTSSELTDATIHYIDKSDEMSASNDPTITAEKGELVQVEDVEQDTLLLSHEEQFPIDPNAEEETQQFTFRAVLVGCILGGVIAASKSVLPDMSDIERLTS